MPGRLKRKTSSVEEANPEPKRTKNGKAIDQTAASSKPTRSSSGSISALNSNLVTRSKSNDARNSESPMKSNSSKKIIKKGIARKISPTKKSLPVKSQKRGRSTKSSANAALEANGARNSNLSAVEIEGREPVMYDEAIEESDYDGPSYWLMKAEPESRIEKGKDVKFSIDDLKNAVEPEAWDGK